jgi:FtsP/CotA-like multicopper oxidase with cupredoxin domain
VATRLIATLAALAALNAFAAETPEKSFNLTIAHGTVPAEQRVLRVEKGDAVRVRVTADTAGELHLHGYKVEKKLVPGTPVEITVKAFATGRFPFEWHGEGEATQSKSHHGPPLAALEVRPK